MPYFTSRVEDSYKHSEGPQQYCLIKISSLFAFVSSWVFSVLVIVMNY